MFNPWELIPHIRLTRLPPSWVCKSHLEHLQNWRNQFPRGCAEFYLRTCAKHWDTTSYDDLVHCHHYSNAGYMDVRTCTMFKTVAMWAILLSHWQASSQNHAVTVIVSPCNCLSTIILHIRVLLGGISNWDLFILHLPLLFSVSSLNLTSGHIVTCKTRYYCTPIFCVPCKTFPRKVKRKTILQASIIYWRMRDQENCNFLDSMKIVQ